MPPRVEALCEKPARSLARGKARVVGPVAARALRPGALGCVFARFARSFYVELDAGFICVGGASLGAGPLTLVCTPMPAADLRAHLSVGDAVRIETDSLRAGPLRIDLGEADPWWPAAAGSWDRHGLVRGLSAADAALRSLGPQDGLACLARASTLEHQALARAAAAPLRHLGQWLSAAGTAEEVPPEPAKIAPLIGLGPGLTPSGDDVLGGVLVALSVLGCTRLRDGLWRVVHSAINERTTPISRAHLAAAAEGLGGAQLHEVLRVIMTGASEHIPAACAALGRVGHTSGWDALAGALMVLRAIANPPPWPGGEIKLGSRPSGSADV
jgi:Protein of unknown function (DUF2877)